MLWRTKRELKNAVTEAAVKTRAVALFRRFYAGMGTIVMLHRVLPSNTGLDILGLAVTHEDLENAIAFFKNADYEIVSLDALTETICAGKVNRRQVVFTFDDGYADVFTDAYPILKRHGVPFTVYVTTSFPDGNGVFWWYLLRELVMSQDHLRVRMESESYEWRNVSQSEKHTNYVTMARRMLAAVPANRDAILRGILEPYSVDIYSKSKELPMSWDQIRQLSADSLVTIGAHTVHHYALSRLSEVEARQEMLDSRERLAQVTGKAIRHFAYPFGTYREVGPREFQLAKECGFDTATTTNPGNVFLAHLRYMHCLPRIGVPSGAGSGEVLRKWTNGENAFQRDLFRPIVTVDPANTLW